MLILSRCHKIMIIRMHNVCEIRLSCVIKKTVFAVARLDMNQPAMKNMLNLECN